MELLMSNPNKIESRGHEVRVLMHVCLTTGAIIKGLCQKHNHAVKDDEDLFLVKASPNHNLESNLTKL